MKQLLSGNDWMVSHFLPDEVSPIFDYISQTSHRKLYGASFIPATVPGDVQSDAIDAGLIEDIHYGYNARSAEWTSQRDWLYVKWFTPVKTDCRRVRLCFDGVDDACEVYFNGQWLGNHEIPWIPFTFDVTDMLRYGEENAVQVVVKAAPQGECQWGRTSSVRNLKPRFAYGWDFATRLVPLGIWRDVYLCYDAQASIDDLHVVTTVDARSRTAVVTAKLTVDGAASGYRAKFLLTSPDGISKTIIADVNDGAATAVFTVENAKLWWPNGMGDQPLYGVCAIIGDDWDTRSCRIGLRHITWTRTEGAGEDAMAYQPYVNGRRVYLQGYNHTPIRQLYGRANTQAYQKRLALVKASGANILRVWGAGLLEREIFYDLCDEYGILVLQELFQSSATRTNHPPRDQAYIEMLVKAAESAIRQKRNHPSLAVWCGGNELCIRADNYIDTKGNILAEGFEGMDGYTYPTDGRIWIPLDAEYPTLVALREVVHRLDPDRMWFHTSGSGPYTQNANLAFLGGSMHDVHGPWQILPPQEFYDMYNALDMMLHAEFGCPGSASVQALEAFLPEAYLWPLDETNPMANYHGRMWAVAQSQLAPYFGAFTDYKTYAHACRFIQWEQLRYALEAHRRLGKRCAGACLWHLGEPWANACDTCSIDVYDQPKPAFYGEKAAFALIHIALRYESVIHKDRFRGQVTLYNATDEDIGGRIAVELFDLYGTCLGKTEGACFAAADTVVPDALSVVFENLPDGVFFLRQTLYGKNGLVLTQGYSIHSTREVPYRELLTQPVCEIEAQLCGNVLKLRNTGNAVASAVTVECELSRHTIFSDGCIMLLPGEEKEVTLAYDCAVGDLYISGFGVPYGKLVLKDSYGRL